MIQFSAQPDWPAAGDVRPVVLAGSVPGSEEAGGTSVYAQIRNWVVSTPLPIGRRIRAADIAEALKVSNTPVREALIRLSAEGLIENRRGTGFFVPVPSVDDAMALFEASHLIVRWSLKKVRNDGLAIAVEAPQHPLQRSAADVARLCGQFNQAVVGAIDNPILSGVLANLDDRLFQLRLIDARTPSVADRQVTVIGAVVKALRIGHGDVALGLLAEYQLGLVGRIPHLVERRIVDGVADTAVS